MNILGLADGPRPSAALIVDGTLVSVRTDNRTLQPQAYGVPWRAAEGVLHDAGLSPDQVDHVAVAGKFSPMLLLRQYPRLRRLRGGAFSATRDVHAMAQAFLRQSGLGALESDRAADWWTEQLVQRGYAPRRLQLISIHRALASASYRCQSDDDVLVLSMHPMGDGVVAAVHRGEAGYLERVWEQRGSSALQVHLSRCAEVLGAQPASPMRMLSTLAGQGIADPDMVEELAEWLRVEDGRIVGRRRPVPGWRRAGVYERLGDLDPADAAASLLHNLRDAVCGLVSWHLRAESIRDVRLAGALLQDPRLVATVAQLPGVETVSALPLSGATALSIGAAASMAGMAPRPLCPLGLGPHIDETDARAAIVASECVAVKRRSQAKWLADQLAAGKTVARLQDRGGLGRWGLGRSAVLVRADKPGALEQVRRNLGRGRDEEPICLLLDDANPGEVRNAKVLCRAIAHGTASVTVDARFASALPAPVARDGRVCLARVTAESDPVLHDALTRLRRDTGCAAVAGFPLAAGDAMPVETATDAVQVFVTSRLDALLLGPFGVLGSAC